MTDTGSSSVLKASECRGMCLRQAYEEGDELKASYVGHGHIRYQVCESKCMPVICPNQPMCKNMQPQCILDANQGSCMSCAVAFGGPLKRKELKEPEECPVCMEDVKLLMDICGTNHYLCIKCIDHIERDSMIGSDEDEFDESSKESKCPLCRRIICPWTRGNGT